MLGRELLVAVSPDRRILNPLSLQLKFHMTPELKYVHRRPNHVFRYYNILACVLQY